LSKYRITSGGITAAAIQNANGARKLIREDYASD
jgi:hypothetical protein